MGAQQEESIEKNITNVISSELSTEEKMYIIENPAVLKYLESKLKDVLTEIKTYIPRECVSLSVTMQVKAFPEHAAGETQFAKRASAPHGADMLFETYSATKQTDLNFIQIIGTLNGDAIYKSLTHYLKGEQKVSSRVLTPMQIDAAVEELRSINSTARCIYLIPIMGYANTVQQSKKFQGHAELIDSQTVHFFLLTAYEQKENDAPRDRPMHWGIQFSAHKLVNRKETITTWFERTYENVQIILAGSKK